MSAEGAVRARRAAALLVAAALVAWLAAPSSSQAAAKIKLYPVPSPDAGLTSIVAGPGSGRSS